MSEQSSDLSREEISYRGRRSKHRQRRGPWEIHYEWLEGSWNKNYKNGVWKSYADEDIARKNIEHFQRQYKMIKFTLVYNKDKEKNGL